MPTSERFYVGFIEAAGGGSRVWLTDDGTEEGTAAKIEVSGDDLFDGAELGTTITQAAGGKVHRQSVELDSAGVEFEIKISFCPSLLLSLVRPMLKATRGTSAELRVYLSSVKRTIDVLAIANGNNFISTGSFSGAMIRDVILRLVSTGTPAA